MSGEQHLTPAGTAPAPGAAPAPVGEPDRLLRLPETLATVGLKRSAWFNLVRSGAAPQPVHIGRATAWLQSELQGFIRERVRMSRGVQ
jgi:predicted DNA-binding transcriptional regulator AlpA